MTRALPLFLLLLVASVAGALAQSASTPRAAPDEEWPLGVWEGAHRDISIDSDATRCEFSREYGRLRWRMTRKTTLLRAGPVTLSAAGFVTQLSASSIEMDGLYSTESGRDLGGLSVRYVLTRTDNTLAGSATTSRSQGSVTLTKR
jgi:hypothetical protein